MFVKSANEDLAILQDVSHSMLNMLQHLATLATVRTAVELNLMSTV